MNRQDPPIDLASAPPARPPAQDAGAAVSGSDATDLLVCPFCEQAHRWVDLQPGRIARCSRCDGVLARGHRLHAEALLALTVTALIAFVVANGTELITIRLRGAEVATSLPGAIVLTWRDGAPLIAVLAAFSAIVAPAAFIALRLALLVPLVRGRHPRHLGLLLRIAHLSARWNTVPVLAVGALLSLVRIAELASAIAGPGLIALGALVLLLAAIESAGLRHLWPDSGAAGR